MKNREQLFRAKTNPKSSNYAFNNIWVYGDLIHNKNKYYIHPLGNAFMTDGELSRLMVTHEVIPETIGEYTDWKDKNGKQIFEGDICVIHKPEYRSILYTVEWEQATSRFYLSSDIECEIEDFENLKPEDIEVIGNIHDKAEIIKVDNISLLRTMLAGFVTNPPTELSSEQAIEYNNAVEAAIHALKEAEK